MKEVRKDDPVARCYKRIRDATLDDAVSASESIGVLTLVLHELTAELNAQILAAEVRK